MLLKSFVTSSQKFACVIAYLVPGDGWLWVAGHGALQSDGHRLKHLFVFQLRHKRR